MDISNLFFTFCFFFLTNFIVFAFYVFVSNFPLLHCSEDYEVDRLSELPDSLILEILSLLPTRDVVRTTLLSKGWRDLWTTVPCLDFELPEDNQNSSKFQDFVSGALALWKGSKIKKFSLSCSDIPHWWLLFAVEKQVEELKIWLMPSVEDQIWVQYEYPIPSFLYLCSSIKKLDLCSCALEVKDEENVQWDKLVSLKVETLERLSRKTLNKLLSGAPRLEILELRVLGNDEELNIRSSSLKMLKIDMLPDFVPPMLRIWAPNLENLKLLRLAYTRCLLKVPSVTSAVLGFGGGQGCIVQEEFLRQLLLSLRHVDKITLSNLCVKTLCEMKKKDMPMPLSNANFLELYASSLNKVLDVLEVFPQLKTLVIAQNNVMKERSKSKESRKSSLLEPPTNFQCSVLENIREVEVTWLVPDTSVYLVMGILLKNARMLEKMVFRPILFELEEKMITSMSDFEAEEKKKVLSMERSSPNAEVFVICGGRELAYWTYLMLCR